MRTHQKRIFTVALSVAVALSISSPCHAQKKTKAAQAPSPKYEPIELIETAKRYLETCDQDYKKSKATAELSRITGAKEAGQKAMWRAVNQNSTWRAAQEDSDRAEREAYLQFDTSPFFQKHKECIQEGKSKVTELIKPQGKAPQPSGLAKDMIAQWLTAIDSLEGKNFEAERSKFETLANRLTLE